MASANWSAGGRLKRSGERRSERSSCRSAKPAPGMWPCAHLRRSVRIAAMGHGPFGHFDAHHRLALALIAAAAGFLVTRGRMDIPVLTIMVWNVFCWSLLVLAWMRIIW